MLQNTGLITSYDIQPENKVGLFLEPQNPHQATTQTDSEY